MRDAYFGLMIKSPGNICPESFGRLRNVIGLTIVGRLAYRFVLGLLAALFFFSQAEAAPVEVVLTNAGLKSAQAGVSGRK